VNVEQGRIKDHGDVKVKSFFKEVAGEYGLDMVLTPSQSVIIKNVPPAMKPEIEQAMRDHGVLAVEEIDPLTRLSIACPAMPMCGLAITEVHGSCSTLMDFVMSFFLSFFFNSCICLLGGARDACLRRTPACSAPQSELGRRRAHAAHHRLPQRLRAPLHGGIRPRWGWA
jgi:hypothetical protein